jgi:hypothetical protein
MRAIRPGPQNRRPFLVLRPADQGPQPNQFFGDEAELWFDGQDPDHALVGGGYQQQDAPPPLEDAWDHFAQDDDEQVIVDELSLVSPITATTSYYGEDAELADQDEDDYLVVDGPVSTPDDPVFADVWEHFLTEDDDQVILPDDPTDGITQYYGEEAELADQEDDDQVVVDSQPTLQGDAPIEDGFDWWAQEDDDYVVIDDYALVENLSPVEDAWDHWVTDDDDQVDVAEFALISVALTTLQYYGEDAENADSDFDDVEWQARDTDVLAADVPPQFFGDDAELETQEGDEPLIFDDQISVPDVLAIEDGWDHFSDGDDQDTAPADDYQSAAPLSQLVEDAWDHWLTDEDDYTIVDDYEFPTSFSAFLTGMAIAGGLSFGTCLGMMPVVFQQYDPRFFNGSNAWLGYRTSSGGGIY